MTVLQILTNCLNSNDNKHFICKQGYFSIRAVKFAKNDLQIFPLKKPTDIWINLDIYFCTFCPLNRVLTVCFYLFLLKAPQWTRNCWLVKFDTSSFHFKNLKGRSPESFLLAVGCTLCHFQQISQYKWINNFCLKSTNVGR